MKKSKEKLDKAHETHSMAQKNLQKLLDHYKAESKEYYLDSIDSMKSVEKGVRAKLDLIEQEHVSELNDVKRASRLHLQEQHARSKAKIDELKAESIYVSKQVLDVKE